MKTISPLFIDKAKLLYKEFHHYTPNGNPIYMYIFERLERLDNESKTYKPYTYFDTVKMIWDKIENLETNTIYNIEYTRKNRNSWDFKILNATLL